MGFTPRQHGPGADDGGSTGTARDTLHPEGAKLAGRCHGDPHALGKLISTIGPNMAGPVLAAAQRMYGNRFVVDALTPKSEGADGIDGNTDVEELAQIVMMLAAQDASGELRAVAEQMKADRAKREAAAATMRAAKAARQNAEKGMHTEETLRTTKPIPRTR